MLSRAAMDALCRRADWFLTGLTSRKLVNGFASAMAYGIRASWSSPWPPALKIDLSPACNLKCTSCIHAEPGTDELLRQQRFSNKQMTVRQFRSIVDEVKGHVSALSLYYLGDPFAHPHIDEMCRIASEAGLNVHLSTNFSFQFSEARIRSILESGVSHLTVCVDGFSQATYEKTRKSGRLPWVLSNLERVSRARKAFGRASLKIEVQYLKYQHNVHELAVARSWFERIGVDSVVEQWGMVSNCVENDPRRYTILAAKKAKILPLCLWPYNSFVIRYDGEVLPCCNHRLATQYVEPTTTWGYGNIFTSGVREVWQSASYHRLRRLVCAPEHEASKEDFCFGCSNLFETNGVMNRKAGPEYELVTSGPSMTDSSTEIRR